MATTLMRWGWIWAIGDDTSIGTARLNFIPIRDGIAQISLGRHRVVDGSVGSASAFISQVKIRGISGAEQTRDISRAMLPLDRRQNLSGVTFQLMVRNADATASFFIFSQD